MFDNLVESSSHKDDISRKGSFIIATTVIYAVILVAFFVAGIYWYDNHLGQMELELTTLVAPVPVPQDRPGQGEAALARGHADDARPGALRNSRCGP